MSELFTPPRYFKDVAFHKHTDRTIGWLELFYDLVYVATLIQIGNFLSDNLTLLGFGQFLVMLFVVWWSWGGETCNAVEKLEHPTVEYDGCQEAHEDGQKETQFHRTIQVRDGHGWATWREVSSADLPRT